MSPTFQKKDGRAASRKRNDTICEVPGKNCQGLFAFLQYHIKTTEFSQHEKLLFRFAAIAIVLIPASASAAKTKETCTIKGNLKNAPDTLLAFTNPQSIQRDPVLTHKGSVNFCINV